LQFIDVPGCDSEHKGKDDGILKCVSTLGDLPILFLFVISPENVSKKTTLNFLKNARDEYKKETEKH
jgi:hypothetical protein